MKKRVSILLLILSMLFSAFLFSSCDSYEAPTNFDNATEVKIMSYNIVTGNNDTKVREAIVSSILTESPDVLGVQEADYLWLAYLDKNLTGYTQTQEGRDGVSIYYKPDKYNLIQSGICWYSLTPNKTSMLEDDARYSRCFSFAKLEDKATGSIFVYFNTHLDYGDQENARRQVNILTEYAKLFKDYPIFFTGDFNQHTTSSAYQLMTSKFVDSSLAIEGADRVGTYNAWNDDASTHTIIDYCFVSKDNVKVIDYQTLDERPIEQFNGNFMSDHFAICATVKIINKVKPEAEIHDINNTIFKCGDTLYGDISFNIDGIKGVECSFENNTVILSVDKGEKLVLDGIETGGRVNLCFEGRGEIVINGDVETCNFKTSDKTTVIINGEIDAEQASLGSKTHVAE